MKYPFATLNWKEVDAETGRSIMARANDRMQWTNGVLFSERRLPKPSRTVDVLFQDLDGKFYVPPVRHL